MGGIDSLTAQQKRCLALVGDGLTTKEIAHELGRSQRTIDEHIEKAVAKLGAPSRQRAAAMLRRHETSAVPAPKEDPYPVRGENSPVDGDAQPDAPPAATLRVSDGERLPFEGFPTIADPEPAALEDTADRLPVDRLRVISQILSIAGLLALVLLAVPALANGAQAIATYLLQNVKR